MKRIKNKAVVRGIVVGRFVSFFIACGGGGGGGGSAAGGDVNPPVVDPGDPASLSRALSIKLGGVNADFEEGAELPESSEDPDRPQLRNLPEAEQEVAPRDDLSIPFDVDRDSALAVLYAKVSGGNGRFSATLPASQSLKQSTGSELSFDLTLPANLSSGSFCLDVAVEDEQGRVSDTGAACFVVQTSENDIAEVFDRMQGSWQRCAFANEFDQLDFTGDRGRFRLTRFETDNCVSGTELEVEEDTEFRFVIGDPVTLNNGIVGNELDIVLPSGETRFDVIFVSEGSDRILALADDNSSTRESRPNEVDLQNPYRP